MARYGQGSYIPGPTLCLALVWLGTVACQMLQKVVMKLAASCQVTQNPGEDASTRCDNTKLGACTLVISITLSSLQRRDPPWPLQNTWTREGLNLQRGGGGPSCEWFTSARNLWCDRSLPLPKDCPQYIPKGKPTPASKLAFVTSCGCSCKIVSKGSCSSCSCSCSCLRDVIVVVVW